MVMLVEGESRPWSCICCLSDCGPEAMADSKCERMPADGSMAAKEAIPGGGVPSSPADVAVASSMRVAMPVPAPSSTMRSGEGDSALVACAMIVEMAAGGYEGRARSYSPDPPAASNPLRATLFITEPALGAAAACCGATVAMVARCKVLMKGEDERCLKVGRSVAVVVVMCFVGVLTSRLGLKAKLYAYIYATGCCW